MIEKILGDDTALRDGGVFGLISFGKIVPVAPLISSPSNPSSMAVADLGVDPASYLDLTQPALAQ